MFSRRDAEEIREQSSVFFHEDMHERRDVFSELYTAMFIQDLSQALLPAWATRDEADVSVGITPSNPDLEWKLSSALDISRQAYSTHDFGYALSEFLRLTMVELCINRQAVFEIVYIRSTKESQRDRFELVSLNHRRVLKRWGNWYQVVPPEIAKKRQIAEKIRLPNQNIAVFTLPMRLARQISSTVDALGQLSDHGWHSLAIEAQKGKSSYEFSVHERSLKLALAEATHETSWPVRSLLTEKITNYYSLRQNLKFQLFAIEVREALLEQLNTLLQRTGSVLDWSAQISINGLPTRQDLNQALGQLASGDKPFTDVMKSVRNT